MAGFKQIYLFKEEFCSLKLRSYHVSYAAQSLYVDKPTCKLIDTILDFVCKNKCYYMKKYVILNSYNKSGLHIDLNSLNYALK